MKMIIAAALIGIAPSMTQADNALFIEECAVLIEGDSSVVELAVPLANTTSQRAQGLSERSDPGEGMLFEWPDNHKIAFWMKGTSFDLDIAFIGSDGEITSIHRMVAGSEELIEADSSAIAALEVPSGFFHQEGIWEGNAVTVSDCYEKL